MQKETHIVSMKNNSCITVLEYTLQTHNNCFYLLDEEEILIFFYNPTYKEETLKNEARLNSCTFNILDEVSYDYNTKNLIVQEAKLLTEAVNNVRPNPCYISLISADKSSNGLQSFHYEYQVHGKVQCTYLPGKHGKEEYYIYFTDKDSKYKINVNEEKIVVHNNYSKNAKKSSQTLSQFRRAEKPIVESIEFEDVVQTIEHYLVVDINCMISQLLY